MFLPSEITALIAVPSIAGLSALTYYITEKWSVFKNQAKLIQRLVWLMAPVAVFPDAFSYLNIHHYWLYAVYVIPAIVWIGSGVWTGFKTKYWWEKNFKITFWTTCFSLVWVGVMLHFLLQAKPF